MTAVWLSSRVFQKDFVEGFSWLIIIQGHLVGWRQDNGNRSNQESKFDFLATHQCLAKIDKGQQKRKIVRTN